ncbi:MAG: putative peptidoglycan glycosyltransferase FtsW [bacterium]|nr:putative peptidoglycan glycosyltransferase FtsW [bacterium]
MKRQGVDVLFLGIVLALLVAGFFIFVSASMGSLMRGDTMFNNIVVGQILFGFIGGGICMFIASRIKYTFWRKHALLILCTTIIFATLVFVPGLGMEHGGAKRWIDLGITTFQPGELLKFGLIVYLAAWLALFHKRIRSPYFGIVPLMIFFAIAAGLLLKQPDFGTFAIATAAGILMFLAAGAAMRDIFLLGLIALIAFGGMALSKPYFLDRISTFLHPDDFQGSGYQVRQALIAIGSGGPLGRGYGQSIQKFNYLPEAHGDSIFAVAAEEFGFWGTTLLVLLYLLFALRGLWIGARAPDMFGGLLVVGLVMLVLTQSFVNVASMLNLLPLTGVPLVFVSHGGTALLVAMAEVGIILNISRYRAA